MAYLRRLELKTIDKMVGIYCQAHHTGHHERLCPECSSLLAYAQKRLEKCPYGEDKPVCSQCTIHCYPTKMREHIKQVMAYAGPRMLTRSPILTARYIYRKKFKRPPAE